MKKILIPLLLIALVAFFSPNLLRMGGLYPQYTGTTYRLDGKRALIVTTSRALLNDGELTGAWMSDITIAYKAFTEAGMNVDIASIDGGEVPIESLSQKYFFKALETKELEKDADFVLKMTNTRSVAKTNFPSYDVIFLAGGLGASYDFRDSVPLTRGLSNAYAYKRPIGSVGYGVLGLLNITYRNSKVMERSIITGMSSAQMREMKQFNKSGMRVEYQAKITNNDFVYNIGLTHFFSTKVVIHDDSIVMGQNQNSVAEVAHELMRLSSIKR